MFFDIAHSLESPNLSGSSDSAESLTSEASGQDDFLVALLNSLPIQLPPTPISEAVQQQLAAVLPPLGQSLPHSGNALPMALLLPASDQPVAQQSPLINHDGEQDALPLSPLRQLPEVLLPDVRLVAAKAPVPPDAPLLPPAFDLPVFQPAPHGHVAVQASTAPLDYPSTAQTPSFSLPQTLGRPEWGEALGTRVVWLARQGIQGAEVRLHPAHLGPIEIHVSIADETARVAFAAHHSHTREALEAALPQLKEMFAQQGLQLADAAVSHRFSDSQGGDRNPTSDHSTESATESRQEGEVPPARVRVGLVDDYA